MGWIKKYLYILYKERFILALALSIGLLFTTAFAYYTKSYSETIQSDIAERVIRFHVLANSDSEEDQALKRAVRDAVLEKMKDQLNSSENIDETRQILKGNLSDIEKTALKVIHEWGKNYPVQANLTQSDFPTKEYGDVVFPAGEYEALRIEIGAAKGKNWWCVMFPPLCFVDITHGVVPDESKDQLKNILTEDEYDLVLSKDSKNMPLQIKFKIVEWWQEREYGKTQKTFARQIQ